MEHPLSTLFASFHLVVHAAGFVTEFGARGDGIVDATRAIQSALDRGKNVVIPEGAFRIYVKSLP